VNVELSSERQSHGQETGYQQSGPYVCNDALAALNAVAAMASTTLDVDEVLRRALGLGLALSLC